MPLADRPLVLPLALMQKRRLRVFQLLDEDGRRCPTLTRKTRTYVAQLALVGLARQVLGRAPSDKIQCDLETLAAGNVPTAYPIHQAFVAAALKNDDELAVADGVEKERAALFSKESFRIVAYALTWSYLLLVSVPPEFGRRRVMSFSYDERLIDRPRHDAVVPGYAKQEHRPSLWQRTKWRTIQVLRTLGRILGWAPRRFDFPCAALAYCCAYHLEVEAPPATLISFAGLFVTTFWSPSRNPHTLSRDDSVRLLERHRGPDDWEKGSLRRSHVYVPDTPNVAQGIAEVSLRPARGAFVQGIALTAALSVGLLMVALELRDRLVDVGAGTTLLLVLPTALLVYVIQPASDHALAARLLTTIRGLGILVGLCLIAAAGTLVVAKKGEPPSEAALEVVLIVSAFALLVLVGSWLQARPRRYQSSDRGDKA
jgi:hypothetical protein